MESTYALTFRVEELKSSLPSTVLFLKNSLVVDAIRRINNIEREKHRLVLSGVSSPALGVPGWMPFWAHVISKGQWDGCLLGKSLAVFNGLMIKSGGFGFKGMLRAVSPC